MLTDLGKGINHLVDFEKITEGSIIIDAGAGRGQFIDKMLEFPIAKKSNFFSFECNRSNIEFLKKKSYENVTFLERALVGSDYPGQIEFTEFLGENGKFHQWGNIFGLRESIVKNRKEFLECKKYKVDTLDINLIFEELDVEKIDYFKIDIEGAEGDLFKSIEEEIASRVSQFSIEFHENVNPDLIIQKLQMFQFETKLVEKNHEIYACKVSI